MTQRLRHRPLLSAEKSAGLDAVNPTLEGKERADGMPRYSEEFKGKGVGKMMPPNARTVADMHRYVSR